MSQNIEKALTPADVRDLLAFIKSIRTATTPFDIIQSGDTPGDDKARARTIVAPYEEAGATWWFESPLPWKTPLDKVRERIRQGPPRG
jgi:hypothetical protein